MITKNKTSIENELKKLNSNFNTFNKIMSSFLVIATSESTFKNKSNKQIKTIVPVVSSTLKAINDSIYNN
jgi:hypothetical protein